MKRKLKSKEERREYKRLFSFNKSEFEQLNTMSKNSSVPSIGGFVRQVLFQRPITAYHRNRSLDDFMEEMILLRKEMQEAGLQLQKEIDQPPAFLSVAEKEAWLIRRNADRDAFLSITKLIQNKIDQVSDIWLQ